MKKTVKRLLALGMTLSIAVGMFPVTAMAADGMPDSYDFRGKTSVDTSVWNVVNPDPENYTVDSTAGLTLTTQKGDIYGTGEDTNNAKNIFVQKSAIDDDWVAETKITLGDTFGGDYQQGAIIAYQDVDNYVKFSYEHNSGNGGSSTPMILQLSSEKTVVEDGETVVKISATHSNELQKPDANTVIYLRLTKETTDSGTTYSAAYSIDGVNFKNVCTPIKDNPMTDPVLALAAFNGGGDGNKRVTFAYIAAMTAEQAADVGALETKIAALPDNVDDVTSATFGAIAAAKADYDALDSDLQSTVVTKADHLNDLVKRVADMEAAAAVDTLIEAIGTVEPNDTVKVAIKAARDAFDKLDADQKPLVEKKAVLEAAEVDYVEALINDIGTVTLDSKEKIDAAKAAFGALTDTQKAQVSNKDDLTADDAAYAVLAVKAKITAIGTPITMASENKITDARTAYNALPNGTEKDKVTNYGTLTDAEAVLAVVQKIHAIGIVYATDASKNEIKAAQDAYTELSDTQDDMVGNYTTLQNAVKAQTVVEKIAAIGTVAATSACKDKIADARSAFNALTDAQEAIVGNKTTLLTAEADYVKALINDIGTVTLDSKAKIEAARTAYNNLTSGQKTAVGSTIYAKLTAAEAALADLTAAAAVDTKIAAIGTVEATTACKAKIDAARTAYDALTTAQKALVKKYDDLTNAEQLYALLAALEGPCDGGTNCPAFPFVDVDPTQWYHAAVDYALDEGLFKGVSATQFAPNGTMTRAMIWTVLARMDDANLAVTTPWYKSAQNWAVNNQVSDGATPDGSVTREQLVTMLWRFVGEPDANGTLAGYSDAGKVSSWAKEAMTWAVANGVVQGVGNANGTVTLNPGATATRAQVAQMFMNFLTK